MLHDTALIASILIMVAVCAALIRRRLTLKLPAFAAFMFLATTQQVLVGGYLLVTGDKYGYTTVQSFLSPLFGVLQACASLEAYRWLVMSLVNFTKIGVVVLVALVVGSISAEIFYMPAVIDASTMVGWLETVERSVSYALAITLVASLLLFKWIGTPSTPRWHAGTLALLAVGNAVGWYLLSAYMVIGTCIAAFGFWLLFIHIGPSWRPIAPQPFDRRGVDGEWRRAEEQSDMKQMVYGYK